MEVPRIYVASLADYNDGRLHGVWLDATDEPDELHTGIWAMLRQSRSPNVSRVDLRCADCLHEWNAYEGGPYACPECDDTGSVTASDAYPSAEEWAVHDHEGFLGVELSEHAAMEAISMIAQLLEEHGRAMAAYMDVNHVPDVCDRDDYVQQFENSYRGCYDSERAYAEECVENGLFGEIPESIMNHIDYDSIARELMDSAYAVRSEDGIHIFEQM